MSRWNRIGVWGALLAGALMLGGCATSLSSETYSRDQVGRVEHVRFGRVIGVRHVEIGGTRSGVGTLAGAAVGGIAGSNLGEGKGALVGAIVGAVGGGLAGSAIEQGTTRQAGLEITVRLDSGRIIAVTQPADVPFYRGNRVEVLSSGGVTRITHAD
ncbi:MAG: glycine zipper 2TM domain-containing protein [Betaproteobacteria bacterium]|nr:glycine zipper 2TM domain-containing protein [Betaproteobacteria bacterium]